MCCGIKSEWGGGKFNMKITQKRKRKSNQFFLFFTLITKIFLAHIELELNYVLFNIEIMTVNKLNFVLLSTLSSFSLSIYLMGRRMIIHNIVLLLFSSLLLIWYAAAFAHHS